MLGPCLRYACVAAHVCAREHTHVHVCPRCSRSVSEQRVRHGLDVGLACSAMVTPDPKTLLFLRQGGEEEESLDPLGLPAEPSASHAPFLTPAWHCPSLCSLGLGPRPPSGVPWLL